MKHLSIILATFAGLALAGTPEEGHCRTSGDVDACQFAAKRCRGQVSEKDGISAFFNCIDRMQVCADPTATSLNVCLDKAKDCQKPGKLETKSRPAALDSLKECVKGTAKQTSGGETENQCGNTTNSTLESGSCEGFRLEAGQTCDPDKVQAILEECKDDRATCEERYTATSHCCAEICLEKGEQLFKECVESGKEKGQCIEESNSKDERCKGYEV